MTRREKERYQRIGKVAAAGGTAATFAAPYLLRRTAVSRKLAKSAVGLPYRALQHLGMKAELGVRRFVRNKGHFIPQWKRQEAMVERRAQKAMALLGRRGRAGSTALPGVLHRMGEKAKELLGHDVRRGYIHSSIASRSGDYRHVRKMSVPSLVKEYSRRGAKKLSFGDSSIRFKGEASQKKRARMAVELLGKSAERGGFLAPQAAAGKRELESDIASGGVRYGSLLRSGEAPHKLGVKRMAKEYRRRGAYKLAGEDEFMHVKGKASQLKRVKTALGHVLAAERKARLEHLRGTPHHVTLPALENAVDELGSADARYRYGRQGVRNIVRRSFERGLRRQGYQGKAKPPKPDKHGPGWSAKRAQERWEQWMRETGQPY